MILNFISRNKCCGCGACVEICPKKALTMEEDEEGFLRPVLNMDFCIDCGGCDNVCPMKSENLVKHEIQASYAAINQNRGILKKSSSGGVFSVIAEYVIKNGGVVYGACFDEKLKLAHRGVEVINDLELLRGSKYLQSYSYECFPKIRQQLRNGKLVYFVGTGCQVAALKLFLRKSYDNLITSDLICHGVPSHKLFDTFVSTYEKLTNREVIYYRCRDKYAGGWSGSQTVDYKTKKGIRRDLFNPVLAGYMKAFMSGDFFRESCFVCPYACEQRSGDITLADYWGIERYHKINSLNGVSAILVNTSKGKEILDKIKSNLSLVETQVDYIKVDNHNLYTPFQRPLYRDNSYKDLKTNPQQVIYQYINQNQKIKIKFWIKHFMLRTGLYALYFNIKRL